MNFFEMLRKLLLAMVGREVEEDEPVAEDTVALAPAPAPAPAPVLTPAPAPVAVAKTPVAPVVDPVDTPQKKSSEAPADEKKVAEPAPEEDVSKPAEPADVKLETVAPAELALEEVELEEAEPEEVTPKEAEPQEAEPEESEPEELAPVTPEPSTSSPEPVAETPSESPAPAEPEPAPEVEEQPALEAPEPVEPAPEEPEPVEPAAEEPEPVEPEPAEAAPEEPAPTAQAEEPEPEKPGPVELDQNPLDGVDEGTDTSTNLGALGGGATVSAGRTTKLELPDSDNIASVKILDWPDFGNVTVNPDMSLAVVMPDPSRTGQSDFRYEVTYEDGSVETATSSLNVVPGSQDQGWGPGEFYMLELDEDEDLVIEHGENHRKVYVSESDDALSISDIAALEGLRPSDIDANWLEANPEYGSDPSMALDTEAGSMLWNEISASQSTGEATSNWLLFERGYTYEGFGSVVPRGADGESEMNPLYIGAYGEGEDPIIPDEVEMFYDPHENVVISNIHLTGGALINNSENVILHDMIVTDGELVVQGGENITLHDVAIYGIHNDSPTNGGDEWDPSSDRISGLFVKDVDGLLLDSLFVDQAGWEDDYQYDMSADGGHAPSMYSHNIYIQWDTTDVTLRDSVIMRSASIGAQLRGGGFIEDNAFIDNNIGFNTLGGDYKGRDHVGNYSLITDNVVTSAGYLTVEEDNGAVNWGFENSGKDSTLTDNIVAHQADPNNPAELDEKFFSGRAVLEGETPIYDDTMVYNWVGGRDADNPDRNDQNVEGLDTDVLDQATIQNFAAELLGKPDATIEDLAAHLRAEAQGEYNDKTDADVIIDYFQTAFGIDIGDIRLEATTVRFVPDELGDGIRWDNRMNWETDDLPGTVAGDAVDLAGNWVNYGGTTEISYLDFGDGGQLNVSHGKLTVTAGMEADGRGGDLNISGAGQLWSAGYEDEDLLDIDVTGGRFANTGEMDGNVDLTASDGEAILATGGAAYEVGAGNTLDIVGTDAQVGFDGDDGDTAVLRLDAEGAVSFSAENGALETIEEFESGAYGETPDVLSGANLGGGTLELDLSGMSGNATTTLIDVDELIGTFGAVDIAGLGSRNATVTIDYEADTVSLSLTSGNGQTTIETVGQQSDTALDTAEAEEMWQALTDGQGTYAEQVAADEDDPLLTAA